jgi:hypothetical protein
MDDNTKAHAIKNWRHHWDTFVEEVAALDRVCALDNRTLGEASTAARNCIRRLEYLRLTLSHVMLQMSHLYRMAHECFQDVKAVAW